MKKIIYLITASFVLASCGGGANSSVDSILSEGNIDAIKAKKTELTTQLRTIESELVKLDSVIVAKSEQEKLTLVSAITTTPVNYNHYLELQGNVQTKQNVLIYPEMAGTLQRVYVKKGQRVNKGQLLATIDNGGMASQVEQLKTQAELSKTTFEKQKRLWEQKIGSEIQFLQAKATYESQISAVKQAESQLGKSTLRAPFSGIIDDVIKDQGTVVAPGPGSEVFRIVNLSNMYIEVDVPETYLGSITKDKKAQVSFPILGETIETQVRQTGNFINPGNRSFTVEIPVSNKKGTIKPNLTAKVRINDYSNDKAILIPQSIVSENADGQEYIYLAETVDGVVQAKRSFVTTGMAQDGMVEVLTGVEVGNLIIKEGARRVKDGQKVEIKNDLFNE